MLGRLRYRDFSLEVLFLGDYGVSYLCFSSHRRMEMEARRKQEEEEQRKREEEERIRREKEEADRQLQVGRQTDSRKNIKRDRQTD